MPRTKVQIYIFKPTGFIDTYFVASTNRWEAIQRAISKYEKCSLAYINYIQADLVDISGQKITT